MKTVSVVLALGFSLPALAQSGRLMGGSAGRGNVLFSYETRLEPPSPPLAGHIGGGVRGGISGMSRWMTESSRHVYFGYDLDIEPLQQPNTYRVTFRPLSLSPEKLGLENPPAWTLLPLPGYPAPQTVHGGDIIALDLMTNPATGQKIVDYARIQNPQRPVYTAAGPARDFTAEDAELRLAEPRVTLNGKLLDATGDFGGGVSGALAWFYLADRGRYILSLVPRSHLGFQKAGEVRGTSLVFTLDGDTFRLESAARIAPGYAPYNLYVLHDPAWRPKTPGESFLVGSADTAESLIRR